MTPPVKIAFSPYQFIGNHTTTALSTGSATGIPLPAGSNAILIQALSANVRIKLDGSNPTGVSGFQIRAGDPPFLLVLSDLMVGTQGDKFLYAIAESAGAILESQAVSQPV